MGGARGGVGTVFPSLLRPVPQVQQNSTSTSHSDRLFCSVDVKQFHLLQISIYIYCTP